MNKVLIVANLKSNLLENEAKDWLNNFSKVNEVKDSLANKEIIICPPFQLLPTFRDFILNKNLLFKLGAQNVSPFDQGAYTGEVNAKQIKEFADYVLIGHSERRANFNESDDMLSQKTELALRYGLSPIFLIQSETTFIPKGVEIIAYEPVFAIGSGNPDSPQNTTRVAQEVGKKGNYQVLYGGSVTSGNVKSFTSQSCLSGVLVGGASLDVLEFIKIIENA
jgi:triosephosphate isomerase